MWAPTSGTATTVRLASREREGAARICCVCRRPLSPSWLRHRISSFPRAPSPTLLSRYTKLAAHPASMTCTRQTGYLHFAACIVHISSPAVHKTAAQPASCWPACGPESGQVMVMPTQNLSVVASLPHFTRAWLIIR